MLIGFRLFQMCQVAGPIQTTLKAYMVAHSNPNLQWFYEDMDESSNEHQQAMMVGRDITMLCNWNYYCEHKGWLG